MKDISNRHFTISLLILVGITVYVISSVNQSITETEKNNSPICDYNTERRLLKYSFDNGTAVFVCVPHDVFLLDKIDGLEQRVSKLESNQNGT